MKKVCILILLLICCYSFAANAIFINKQPSNDSVAAGQRAHFSMAISFADQDSVIFYHWYKNGVVLSDSGSLVNLNEGETDSITYTTPVLSASDSGNYYYCKMSYKGFSWCSIYYSGCSGTKISDTAYLAVSNCVFIVSQPQSVSAYTSDSVSFTIKVIGSAPLVYNWQFTNPTTKKHVILQTDTSNSKSNSFILHYIKSTDASYYSCTVNQTKGCKDSIYSDSVLLNVSTTTLKITSQPSGKTICAGSEITFSVGATGANALKYAWFKKGKPITEANDSSYTTPPLSYSDSGNYIYCIVSDFYGGNKIISDSVLLKINKPIYPAAYVGNDTTVCGGLGYTLGAPAISGHTYSWTTQSNNFTSSLANPAPLNNTTAVYILTETITATGCTNVRHAKVTVQDYPGLHLGNEYAACGNSGSTVIGDVPLSGHTYLWTSNPTGFTSTSSNPTVNSNPDTTYILVETLTSTGCKNTDSFVLKNNPKPAASVKGTGGIICLGDSITIGSPAVSGNTYSWTSNPTGFTSSLANPTVKPGKLTYYTLVEKITKTGCQNNNIGSVNVTSIVDGNAGNDTTICAGDTILIGSSYGYDYKWTSSPAGFTSTLSHPKVSPRNHIAYIRIETNSYGCKKTDSITIQVKPVPSATAGKDTSICNGDSLLIGSTLASGNTYSWVSTPGGFKSSLAKPQVNPHKATTYSLTVKDSMGCSNSDSVTVTPLPVVTVGSNVTICQGKTITLGATGISGITYSWTSKPSGFSSGSPNPSVNPKVTTTYYLTETITASGCTNSDSVTIKVNPNPAVNSGRDTAYCDTSNTSTKIGSTFSSGHSYSWQSIPSGYTSSYSSDYVSPTANTKYILTETIDATGCVGSDTVLIKVSAFPNSNPGKDTSICAGAGVKLGNFIPVSGHTYSWSSNVGLDSTLTNPTVYPTTTTQYGLKENISGASGCSNINYITITVHSLPVVNLGNDTTICQGTEVDKTLNPGPYSYNYSWLNTGYAKTVTNKNSLAMLPYETDTLYVKVTDTALGCSASDTLVIKVDSFPNAKTSGNAYLCYGSGKTSYLGAAAVPGHSYLWTSTPSGFTSTLANPTASPIVSTSYKLVETDTITGCFNTGYAYISIVPLPSINAGKDTAICKGNSYRLLTTSTGADSFFWTSSPAGFASDSGNPVVKPTVNTTYYCKVVNVHGCYNNDTVVIIVHADFNPNTGTGQTICSGDSCLIGSLPVKGHKYYWYNAPINLRSKANLKVSPPDTTIYTLLETDSATGCSYKGSVTVNVKSSPVVDINYYTFTNSYDVQGSEIFFIGNYDTSSDAQYVWSTKSGYTNSNHNFELSHPIANTWYYLTGKNKVTGCQKIDSLYIKSATYQADSQTIIYSHTASFYVTPLGDFDPNGYKFQWYRNDTLMSGKVYNSYTTSATLTPSFYKFNCKITDPLGNTVVSKYQYLNLLCDTVLDIYTQPASEVGYYGHYYDGREYINTDSFDIYVIAYGGNNEKLSYNWYQDGKAIPGATKNQYFALGMMAGKYKFYCVISNGCRVITTDTAYITVKCQLQITKQPEDLNITGCNQGSFHIKASDGLNDISYKWYEDNDLISNSDTTDIYFCPSSVAYQKKYVCQVSGCNTVINSSSVNLKVDTCGLCGMGHLSDQSVYNDSVAIFHVSGISVRYPSGELNRNYQPGYYDYNWYVSVYSYNYGWQNFPIEGAYGPTFITHKYEVNKRVAPYLSSNGYGYISDDAGKGFRYSCRVYAQYFYGSNTPGCKDYVYQRSTNQATVSIACSPFFTTKLKPQTIFAGNTATFSASADAAKSPTFLWLANDSIVAKDSTGATQTSYTTKRLSLADSNIAFQCVFSSCDQYAVYSNYIKVKVLADSITIQPQDQPIASPGGGYAVFSVKTTEDAPDSFVWYKNGDRVKGGPTLSTYTTPSLIGSDTSSFYNCIIYSASGRLLSRSAYVYTVGCPYKGVASGGLTVTPKKYISISPVTVSPHYTYDGGIHYFPATTINHYFQHTGAGINFDAVSSFGMGTYKWYINDTLVASVDSAFGSSFGTPALIYGKPTTVVKCVFTTCAGSQTSQLFYCDGLPCVTITSGPTDVYESNGILSKDPNMFNGDGTTGTYYDNYFGDGISLVKLNSQKAGTNTMTYSVKVNGDVNKLSFQWYYHNSTTEGKFLPVADAAGWITDSKFPDMDVYYHPSLFGTQFLCVVSDSCGYATSNSAWYGVPVNYTNSGYRYAGFDNTVAQWAAGSHLLQGSTSYSYMPDNKERAYVSGIYIAKQPSVADPVQTGTGVFHYTHTDINFNSTGGAIQFTRIYNNNNSMVLSTMGNGWRNSFDIRVFNFDTIWYVMYPDGQLTPFSPLLDGTGRSVHLHAGTYDKLCRDSIKSANPNGFTLITVDNIIYKFDSLGIPLSAEDRNGNITRYNYDGFHHLMSIAAPGGRTIKFTYDSAAPVNRVTSVTSPSSKVYKYYYDALNNLHSVTEPNGDSTIFTYDQYHLLVSVVGALADTLLTNTYDSVGRVIVQKDANGWQTKMDYTFDNLQYKTVITYPNGTKNTAYFYPSGLTLSTVDEMKHAKYYTYDLNSNVDSIVGSGQVEERTYDSLGNLTFLRQAGGNTYTTGFNSFSEPVKVIDPLGHTTNMKYDENGNLDSVALADGAKMMYSYYQNGKLKSSEDGVGNTTDYEYNSQGDLIKITNTNGTKYFTYDNVGKILSATDEKGNTTRYAYDSNGNMLSKTDPLGQKMTYTYDLQNRVITITDKRGSVSRLTYDNSGNLISKINPLNGIDSFYYDSRNNLSRHVDANGNFILYKYDPKNRLISKTNAFGTMSMEYDSLNNLIRVTDPTGGETNYSYSKSNQIKSVTDALGNVSKLVYDSAKNLLSSTDALGNVTTYSYDALNRLSGITDPNGGFTKLAYNANGVIKSLSDPNSSKQEYSYNSLNELSGFKDAGGHTYSYLYDSTGNLTSIVKPSGTINQVFDALHRLVQAKISSGDIYTYTYDADNNLTSMKNKMGTSYFKYDSLNRMAQYTNPFNKTLKFGYDAIGNKTSITYPGNRTVKYTYDKADRLTSVTDWKGNIFKYLYDASGRVLKLNYPNGSYCVYAYDKGGRPNSRQNISNKGDTISSDVFTLNKAGWRQKNRKFDPSKGPEPGSYAYKYTPDNVLLSDSVNSYSNDSTGDRITKTGPKDSLKFSFSVDNLLTLISHSGYKVTIAYDPLGHRIQKSGNKWKTNYLLNISSRLSTVLETADSTGRIKADYIYGIGLLESIDSSGNPSTYYFDAYHNTVAVTDKNDSLVVGYSYNAFGIVTGKKGKINQPFTFLGEYGVERDSSSLYYVRARYYDAVSGRFISKDPLDGTASNPQSFNKYIYSLNNPVSIFDISGYSGNQDGGTPGKVSGSGSLVSLPVSGNDELSFANGSGTAQYGKTGVKVSGTVSVIQNTVSFDVGKDVTLINSNEVASASATAKLGPTGLKVNASLDVVTETFGVKSDYGGISAGAGVGLAATVSAGYSDGSIQLAVDLKLGVGLKFNVDVSLSGVIHGLADMGGAIGKAIGYDPWDISNPYQDQLNYSSDWIKNNL